MAKLSLLCTMVLELTHKTWEAACALVLTQYHVTTEYLNVTLNTKIFRIKLQNEMKQDAPMAAVSAFATPVTDIKTSTVALVRDNIESIPLVSVETTGTIQKEFSPYQDVQVSSLWTWSKAKWSLQESFHWLQCDQVDVSCIVPTPLVRGLFCFTKLIWELNGVVALLQQVTVSDV